MRVVFEDCRMLSGIAVPEYFVTDLGMLRQICPSNISLTLCQSEGSVLIPQVKVIWPIESIMSVNPDMARRCMGEMRLGH